MAPLGQNPSFSVNVLNKPVLAILMADEPKAGTKADAPSILAILKKEYPNVKYYLNYTTPFELYIAVVLSAQCKDEVVNETTKMLFKIYKSPKTT